MQNPARPEGLVRREVIDGQPLYGMAAFLGGGHALTGMSDLPILSALIQ
jgi:hypothetical protein